MKLLPRPRVLQRTAGFFLLPRQATLDSASPAGDVAAIQRLQAGLKDAGVQLIGQSAAKNKAPDATIRLKQIALDFPKDIPLKPSAAAPTNTAALRDERYALTISADGILIEYSEVPGLRAAIATLRQLFREFGRRLPRLNIRDWPDFPRRGVMLDISRGRVPRLETLLGLVEQLADFKINEFQLYVEHTFAYRKYRSVWRGWGALTAPEVRRLDARCRELGMDLVPNQNSFGHLRHFLQHPRLKPLAEISEPYEDSSGEFVRHPSTLAPNNPGSLRFLRELYDELLPNFSSRRFNIGGDETWDLGRGQSKTLCVRLGQGRVYLEFLKKIHREVSRRGRQMMFWGDIILKYPQLIPELASFRPPASGKRKTTKQTPNVIALNWGYEANHPFDREARRFAESGIPFYVAPGTSTWMTLIGQHDNALRNLRRAAEAGRKYGAAGYLITDWGDGGHPQPLAVSYPPYLAGAALSWNGKVFNQKTLLQVLDRDIFGDKNRETARAVYQLGLAHRRLRYSEPNLTPLGAVIAAPQCGTRELFCRNGLKYFSRIPPLRVRSALQEIENQRKILQRRKRYAPAAVKLLLVELDLAARMAAESCRFMLWQQCLAEGKKNRARAWSVKGIRALQQLDRDFNAYWPSRNKGTPENCSAFLRWRVADYQRGRS